MATKTKVLDKFLIKIDELKATSPTISKPGALEVAQNLYNQILEGNISATRIAEFFKFMDQVKDEIKDLNDETGKNDFNTLVKEEIRNNSNDGGKSYNTSYGSTLELLEAGTKYDYTVCQDPIWNNLSQQIKDLDKKIKVREKFLKNVDGSLVFTDTETGETFEIYAPVKTSTSTYKVTLSK